MKLAEALAERSDCQVRIEDVKKRIVRSARVQEGETPAEDSRALLKESETLYARLLDLISAIQPDELEHGLRRSANAFRRDCRTRCDGQEARLPCQRCGRGEYPAGQVFEVRGEIRVDSFCGRRAKAGRSTRKALSRTRHGDPGTKLENRIGLRQLVAISSEASTSPARGETGTHGDVDEPASTGSTPALNRVGSAQSQSYGAHIIVTTTC